MSVSSNNYRCPYGTSIPYILRNWRALEVGAVSVRDHVPTCWCWAAQASSRKRSQATISTLFISLCSPEATGKMNLPFRAGLCGIPSGHIHTSPFYIWSGMQAGRDSEVSEPAYVTDRSFFVFFFPLPLEVGKGGQGTFSKQTWNTLVPFLSFSSGLVCTCMCSWTLADAPMNTECPYPHE